MLAKLWHHRLRVPERNETVCQSRRALQHAIITSANPDWNRRRRHAIQADAVERMPTPLERDIQLGPEFVQHVDLLLQPPTPRPKILAERLVLGRVPADADP